MRSPRARLGAGASPARRQSSLCLARIAQGGLQGTGRLALGTCLPGCGRLLQAQRLWARRRKTRWTRKLSHTETGRLTAGCQTMSRWAVQMQGRMIAKKGGQAVLLLG